MTTDWTRLDTGTHQDHVIAHVIGATVLGFFKHEQALHLLLDIGFVWTVYLDCEMGLVPQSLLIKELEVDEETKEELRADLQLLHEHGVSADGLAHFSPAPHGCLITEVTLQARDDEERRLLIEGETASLSIETSLANGEINVTSFAETIHAE